MFELLHRFTANSSSAIDLMEINLRPTKNNCYCLSLFLQICTILQFLIKLLNELADWLDSYLTGIYSANLL